MEILPAIDIIGVSNNKDLFRLSKTGLWGVVVGKAIHEGKVLIDDLRYLC